MKKFTDIKSHIIPEFDDGPFNFDESLEILVLAEKVGFKNYCNTSL